MNNYLPFIVLSSSLLLSQTAFAKSSGQFLVGIHGGQTISSRLTHVNATGGSTFDGDMKNFHEYVKGGFIGYRMNNLSFDIDYTHLPIDESKKSNFRGSYKRANYSPFDNSRFGALFLNASYEASWLYPSYRPFVSIGLGNIHSTITMRPSSYTLSRPDIFTINNTNTETKISNNHLGLQTKFGVNTDLSDDVSIGVNITSLVGLGKYQVAYREPKSTSQAKPSGDYRSHSLVAQLAYAF